MDNKQFAEQLHRRTTFDKKLISRLMMDLSQIVQERTVLMNTISVQGFGAFEPRKKNERISVSPTTGKRMLIPPKMTVSFKPSVAIKNSLKDLPDHE